MLDYQNVLTGLPSRPAGPLSPKSPGKPWHWEREKMLLKPLTHRNLFLVMFPKEKTVKNITSEL